LEWGTIGGGKWEWGGKEEGVGQFTSNLGPVWTGIAPHTKEEFQVSKRTREQGRVLQAEGELSRGFIRGLSRELCHVLSYNVNPVYIVLMCVCCANKRIVFRL
jgi:hypothetical protein